eukprot:742771-Rhodomonas_salina.1
MVLIARPYPGQVTFDGPLPETLQFVQRLALPTICTRGSESVHVMKRCRSGLQIFAVSISITISTRATQPEAGSRTSTTMTTSRNSSPAAGLGTDSE